MGHLIVQKNKFLTVRLQWYRTMCLELKYSSSRRLLPFLFSWASLDYLLDFCEFLSLSSHQSSELQLLMIAILSYQYSDTQLFKFKECLHEEMIRNLSLHTKEWFL